MLRESDNEELTMAAGLKDALIIDGDDDHLDLKQEDPTSHPQTPSLVDYDAKTVHPTQIGMMCLERIQQGIMQFWQKIIDSKPANWVYLALIGVLSALLGFLVERTVMGLSESRNKIANTNTYVGDWLVWSLYSMLLLLISTAITHFLQENAAGSGIPEMKSILGGVVLSRYLTMRTLVTKFLGLIFSLGSAIPIGKEGPYVHMSAIIATQLTRLGPFRYIRQNPFLLRQMQSVAVAVGVATCFGAPVGGVLFSIEVTSTVFSVSNLWRCFYGSAWTIVIFRLLHAIAPIGSYEYTDLDESRFGPTLLLFVLLGILCGLVAALFLYMFILWQTLIEKFKAVLSWRRYVLVIIVCLSIGFLAYPFDSLRISNRQVGNEMFDNENLNQDHWTWGSIYFTLPAYVVCKLIFTSVAICLPVPCGCLTPIFTSGAVLGRYFGELLHLANPSFQPGVFAIVGAAALCSGVTRSLSVVIIVFEITGELHNIVGVLVASLFAYAAAGFFYRLSVYDIILGCRGLPHLPMINSNARIAAELMQVEFGYLHVGSTYAELENALANFKYSDFPVVESEDTPKLVGTLPRHVVYRCVLRHMDAYIQTHGFVALPEEARNKYLEYKSQGVPPAVDTTKAHMMAWWDVINSSVYKPRTTRGQYHMTMDSSITNDRERALVSRPREVRLMEVLRRRGFNIEDGKEKSRGLRMVVRAAQTRDEDMEKWWQALSPRAALGLGTSPKQRELRDMKQVSLGKTSDSQRENENIEDSKHDHNLERYQKWMSRSIKFTKFETMNLDYGPFMLLEETPAQRVAFLMSILGLHQVFILNRGNLLGVITREDLFRGDIK